MVRQLKKGAVHFWKIEIPRVAQILSAFGDCLSAEERDKASHYYVRKDKLAYRVSHISLRLILAAYLDCHPSEIIFEQGKYGKPRLCGQRPGEGICFNTSRSNEIAVVSVAANSEIGTDVEFIRPIEDVHQMILQHFSVDERDYLFSLPQDRLIKGFFTCWTLKEAFVKAIGKGLSYPLDAFSTVDEKQDKPIGERVVLDGSTDIPWYQLPLHVHHGYCAAIAMGEYHPLPVAYDFSVYTGPLLQKARTSRFGPPHIR